MRVFGRLSRTHNRFVTALTMLILPSPERFVEFSSVYVLRWNKVIELYIFVWHSWRTFSVDIHCVCDRFLRSVSLMLLCYLCHRHAGLTFRLKWTKRATRLWSSLVCWAHNTETPSWILASKRNRFFHKIQPIRCTGYTATKIYSFVKPYWCRRRIAIWSLTQDGLCMIWNGWPQNSAIQKLLLL